MLQPDQFTFWLERAARHAYFAAGHAMHPDELARGLSRPGEYITEHSGMDPASLEGMSAEDAGRELAKGIRRTSSEIAAFMDLPEIKAHMEAERDFGG